MLRPKSGPSRNLLLWTTYMLLLAASAAALFLLVTGGVLASTGASVLLWRVIATIRNLAER
jgi:hypothetical protein